MKKRFLLFTGVLLACTMMLNAQGGGGGNFQRRTVEERVKTIHQKMDSAFKLDAAKLTQIDSAFANFYRTTDKIREDAMASGDRQGMREKMQPYADARDKEVRIVLGDDNYKKWKDEIEPSMRRPGGGGGQGGNRQN
jgi:hypothetical protein